jgi:homoserine O-acetyltransferase/O-succinyltransferase
MLKIDSIFHFASEFQLESGSSLPGLQLKYTTLGQLNKDRSNVVWICHALTGSSDFTDWWKELFTDGSPFDPRDYFIICANALGGCYGSTGPLTINPKTGQPFYHEFPSLTNRDIVRAFDLLRQHLGIKKIHTLLGGSLGGQQVLEWAIQQPDVFDHIIPIATNAFHSPWAIAINEAQRMAIEADSTWRENDPRAGSEGMKAARAMGMISFRTYNTYQQTQSEKRVDVLDNFRASSYQRYQGQKLSNRFNAFTYWIFTKAMDSHHVGRGRTNTGSALKKIKAKTLVIGIDTDLLFPVQEQKYLTDQIKGAQFATLSSLHGHDGFLVEFDQFKSVVRSFLKTEKKKEVIV